MRVVVDGEQYRTVGLKHKNSDRFDFTRMTRWTGERPPAYSATCGLCRIAAHHEVRPRTFIPPLALLPENTRPSRLPAPRRAARRRRQERNSRVPQTPELFGPPRSVGLSLVAEWAVRLGGGGGAGRRGPAPPRPSGH